MFKKFLALVVILVVIGSIPLLMGAYDKTYITHNPIYEDGYGPYFGSSSDSQILWNASGYVDWNVTGYVDFDATSKFTMDFSAAEDHTGGLKVTTNVPTGQDLYGGIYSQMNLAGTTDGTAYALRVKANMTSASAPGGIVGGARITVEEAGANQSGGWVVPLTLETYCDAAGNDPAYHMMMRFNTTQGGETPDCWWQAANPEAVAFTANTTHTSASTDKIGAVRVDIVGYGNCYMYIYSSAGQ